MVLHAWGARLATNWTMRGCLWQAGCVIGSALIEHSWLIRGGIAIHQENPSGTSGTSGASSASGMSGAAGISGAPCSLPPQALANAASLSSEPATSPGPAPLPVGISTLGILRESGCV